MENGGKLFIALLKFSRTFNHEKPSTGVIIGWLTAITNALFSVICFLFTSTLKDNYESSHDTLAAENSTSGNFSKFSGVNSQAEKVIFIELTLIMAIVSLAYVYFGYKCVAGVRNVSDEKFANFANKFRLFISFLFYRKIIQ